MVTRMDRDIGRILALLGELGLERNTLVIFTSDNGGAQSKGADSEFFGSNGPFRGHKGLIYEGGIRVPLIARWPGKIDPGTTTEHPSAFWDFLPTAAEIAGVDPPEDVDGISYLPTLLGLDQPEHEYLYWEFKADGTPMQAVRMGDWKAVKLGGEPIELYNLAEDPGERNDLAEANPNRVQRAEQILRNARTPSEHFPLFEE
jgi:arylsulfatase A-like enzyme